MLGLFRYHDTLHESICMASDGGLFWGFTTCLFFPLVLSLGETLGGQEMEGVAILGNELASVLFFQGTAII